MPTIPQGTLDLLILQTLSKKDLENVDAPSGPARRATRVDPVDVLRG